MTRHGQSQPIVEAMLAQRLYHRAYEAREAGVAAVMTPRPADLSARHHAIRHQSPATLIHISRIGPQSQTSRSSSTGTGIPKTP
jgi:hypothetical protein